MASRARFPYSTSNRMTAWRSWERDSGVLVIPAGITIFASPEAIVEINGKSDTYVAREAEEAERAEIWERAVRMYSGYERYKGRAGRKIPIMILTPTQGAGVHRAPEQVSGEKVGRESD